MTTFPLPTRQFPAVAIILAICWSHYALGQTRATPPTEEITVGFLVINISKIDDAEQQINIDVSIQMKWVDPGLVNPDGEMLLADPDTIWTPDVQIVNEVDLKKMRKELVMVSPDGECLYRQRYSGLISSSTDYSNFPFDQQILKVQLAAAPPWQLRFIPDQDWNGRLDKFSVADWKVGPASFTTETLEVMQLKIPACSIQLTGTRKTGYFIWKIFIPLSLVIFMSFTVFWIDPSRIDAQLTVSVTSILTLIAYQFTLSFMVPRVPYLTRLDIFVFGANFLVFAALIEAVASSHITGKGRPELAQKMDYFSRFVFPLIYLSILLKSIWF